MGNTIATSSSEVSPTVARPGGNSLRYSVDTVPYDVLRHILLFVPGRHLIRSASLVCKYWRDLLMDCHFWFEKLQMAGVVIPENTRSRLKSLSKSQTCLLLQMMSIGHIRLNQNLVKNPSGAEKFKYWKVRHGGDGIIVEEHPVGSDPIPEEANLPSQHCFVTSYDKCARVQNINLEESGFTPLVLKTLKPKLIISEWVSARFDCRSKCNLTIDLIGSTRSQIEELEWSSDDEGVVLSHWYKLEKMVTDYPEDLHSVCYRNIGIDLQFWAGHYGSKSAGSSIIFVL